MTTAIDDDPDDESILSARSVACGPPLRSGASTTARGALRAVWGPRGSAPGKTASPLRSQHEVKGAGHAGHPVAHTLHVQMQVPCPPGPQGD